MCENCWEEYDKPQVMNDKVRAAAKLIEELYEWHLAGGFLHIVTDDYNIEQTHIDWCVDQMDGELPDWRDGEEATDVELRCGKALQALTEEERGSAVALYDGYITDDGDEVTR